MKIFGFEIIRSKQEQKQGEAPLFPGLRWTGTGFTLWAGDNPKEYIEKGYAGNSTIYSIVTTCARKFSSVPWYVYKAKKPSSVKRIKALTGSYAEGALFNAQRIKSEEFDEVEEGPMNDLLNRPNGYQSFGEFMEQLLAFKMVTGSAPVFLNKGAVGDKVLGMYVLPTQYVLIRPDASLTYINEAWYTITGSNYPIPIDQLLYWKYHNPLYSNDGWDMMIAFPPCTHLAVSGAAWFEQKRKDGRQQEGIEFFMKIVNEHICKIVDSHAVTAYQQEQDQAASERFGGKFVDYFYQNYHRRNDDKQPKKEAIQVELFA